MPRQTPGRTIDAEDNLRAYVIRWLDEHERGTTWLARRMSEMGCDITAMMIWKSLHYGRRIVVDEALAMAAVFDVPISELVGSNDGKGEQ